MTNPKVPLTRVDNLQVGDLVTRFYGTKDEGPYRVIHRDRGWVTLSRVYGGVDEVIVDNVTVGDKGFSLPDGHRAL